MYTQKCVSPRHCGDQRSMLNVFLSGSLSYFLKQGLSLSLEFTDWLDQLAMEHPGVSAFPGLGLQILTTKPGFVRGCWGSELRFSNLCSKRSTMCASPVPTHFWPFEVESYVLPRPTLKRAAEDDLKLLVLLSSLPGCSDYRCTSPHLVSMVLGSQPRALHTPGWQSTNSTTSPTQSCCEREETTSNLQALPRHAFFSTSLGHGFELEK